MPMSSLEIAQVNGAFQQQSMNQLSYAHQIGKGAYGGQSGAQGDSAMGGAMNRMGAIGGPLAGAAAGLMGFDAVGMGIKGATMGWGMGGGIGGAAAMGAAFALPAMAVGAAVNHGVSQMFVGAQQQQSFNNVLRQSFNFRNASGGSGFDHSQMGQMGEQVREMTHMVGPGGQMNSFGELSQLAGKMGQMGFAQGVRDVKEFGTKFKEMVKHLKTMATDLGTTLEGAMEFAASARSSGMFGMNRISGFTGAARAASVSGGLAMSEVTGMASIGSQISRSVGGLGRQGAMAGIRTIGQLGTAQQMGVLSEEAIYNATGLTGAEGRQALAASSLQQTGSFLRSTKGRYLLGALADKDGSLNEDAVQELLGGGMGIAMTKQHANEMKQKVGRANFIRNEGRLRGAVMERIGGFAPAIALSGWAADKGVDINNMDDRSMLFAQRQLGMGRDEIDQAITMANNMPQIIEQQRQDAKNDQYMQKLAATRGQRGMKGAQQRFDQAVEHVNSKLQKVGADFFQEGSRMIDDFVGNLTDTYMETYGKDVDNQYRAMKAGSSSAAKRFGVGRGSSLLMKRADTSGFGGRGAGGTLAQMQVGAEWNPLTDDTPSNRDVLYDASANFLKYVTQGESDISKLNNAGWDFSRATTEGRVQSKMQTINAMQRAAQTGFSKGLGTTPEKSRAWLVDFYGSGGLGSLGGDARLDQLDKYMRGPKDMLDEGPTRMDRDRWEATAGDSKEKKAARTALAAEWEANQGLRGEGTMRRNMGLPENLRALENGKFTSSEQENEAYARAAGYHEYEVKPAGFTSIGDFFSFGAPKDVSADTAAAMAGKPTARSKAEVQAAGNYLKTEGRSDISNLLSRDTKAAGIAIDALKLENADSKQDGPLVNIKRDLVIAAEYQQAIIQNGGKELTKEQDARFTHAHALEMRGRTIDGVKTTLGGMQAIDEINSRADVRRAAAAGKVTGEQAVNDLQAMGIYDTKTHGLSAAKEAELRKMGGQSAVDFAKASIDSAMAEAGLGGTASSGDDDRERFGMMRAAGEKMGGALIGKSAEERRKIAMSTTGDYRAFALQNADIKKRFDAATGSTKHHKGLGANAAAGGMLGSTLSKEELAKLNLTDDKGASAFLSSLGISGKEQAGLLETVKGGKDMVTTIQNIQGSSEYQNAKKKKTMDAAEAENPLQAAIKKNGENTNELLKTMLKSSTDGQKALADALAAHPELNTPKKPGDAP